MSKLLEQCEEIWADAEYLETTCRGKNCTGYTDQIPDSGLYVCEKCGLVQ